MTNSRQREVDDIRRLRTRTRQTGSPADGSWAGGSGATGGCTVVVVVPAAGTVDEVGGTVVAAPLRVVVDEAVPGRPGRVEVVGPTTVEGPADEVAPKIVVDEVLVLVVDVVVVEVVVVDDGNAPPTMRGGPTSSKCIPSGMLQVPPQANPLRRNT